jgi:Cu(I)/Ag(I) efflux system membrane protein CusA/SilA
VCVLLLGTLFTSLPVSGFDQTINLFALAGLAIAIGEMADATIVIVENCTAELARRGKVSAAERMETIIEATATLTRPLLFSMLIIVTSFLPIFFLGAREGRLFNPLAFSKTFAMAFSSLLTLFLLPAIIVWVFKRNIAPVDGCGRAVVASRRARHDDSAPVCIVGLSAALLIGANIVMTGFQKDYMPEMRRARSYMPTTRPDCRRRKPADPAADGQEAEGVLEVERVFGKLTRRHRHRSRAGRDDRDDRDAEACRMAGWDDSMLIAEMNQAMQIVATSTAGPNRSTRE